MYGTDMGTNWVPSTQLFRIHGPLPTSEKQFLITWYMVKCLNLQRPTSLILKRERRSKLELIPMNDLNPNDVGTRLQHHIELFEVWNAALEIVKASEARFPTKIGQERIKSLTYAVELMQRMMQMDYNERAYSSEINSIKKEKI